MKHHTRHIIALAVAALVAMACCAQRVEFSHPSGLYAGGLTLTMRSTNSNLTIRYTTNGSTPTHTSTAYAAPLRVDSTLYSPSQIFRLQNAPDGVFHSPPTVEHIVVLRAALFDQAGRRCSPVVTGSYVVGSIAHRMQALPVVSICADSAGLFDYDTGIYVPGAAYNPAAPEPNRTGNYYYHGREWERIGHIDMLHGRRVLLNQDCGIRTHGISQRNKMQKALCLYARAEYGEKHFKAKVFEDRPYNKFKRLVLRTMQATEPNSSTGINDWLCQQLAFQLRCDNLATRPVVVFLNGEYWGIQFIEEKPDEHYLKSLHGVDDEVVDVVNWWGHEAENGSAATFNRQYEQLLQRDPTDTANLRWLEQWVDIPEVVDYMLLQLFIQNIDWPANNVRCWSYQGSPWRWVFFDGDYTFCNRRQEVMRNVNYSGSDVHYPTSERATRLFRWMMQSDTIARFAAQRLVELERTVFGKRNTVQLVNTIRDALVAEMPYHIARFGKPVSVEHWLSDLQSIEQVLVNQPQWLTDAFIDQYGIRLDAPIVRPAPLTLYPNPTTDITVLHYEAGWEDDIVLEVYATTGRLVAEHKVHVEVGSNTILLPRLAPGVYVVRLRGKPEVNKLIVR